MSLAQVPLPPARALSPANLLPDATASAGPQGGPAFFPTEDSLCVHKGERKRLAFPVPLDEIGKSRCRSAISEHRPRIRTGQRSISSYIVQRHLPHLIPCW